jgi:hypothetical protein
VDGNEEVKKNYEVSFLCEPSQKGWLALRLQPHSQIFCASVMVNFTGVNSAPA